VKGVLPVELAVFIKLQFLLDVPLVLVGRVVAPIALAALQRHELYGFALRFRHAENILFN
jgi:hypothetical protein